MAQENTLCGVCLDTTHRLGEHRSPEGVEG